uniref:Uncharacterized protein n=1 Tax=Rhizophora mucronata TaxID=61149 RepID=A0A2P2NUX7_RHIMU
MVSLPLFCLYTLLLQSFPPHLGFACFA